MLAFHPDIAFLLARERTTEDRKRATTNAGPGRFQRPAHILLPADDTHPAVLAPYVIDNAAGRRQFVQGRAAELSGSTPSLRDVQIAARHSSTVPED
jgi:hypothetical protein